STSSPFWGGHDTGLKAYRRSIVEDLPRSGCPETLDSWSDWQHLLEVLAQVGLVTDATQIWWYIRPSARHPTLEMRVTDLCTSVEDALSLAALYQCLLHHLWRLRMRNQSWRTYRAMLIEENIWRAQRWGIEAELADYGAGCLKPMKVLAREMAELLREDAAEL